VESNIVVVPDVHLEPGTSLDPSYLAVKRFVKDVKPTAIVALGDFLEVGCFCHHDKRRKLKMEGKRYRSSVDQGFMELEYLANNCEDLYFLMGNHENWVYEYIQEHPELDGAVDLVGDLGLDDLCRYWVEYGEYISVGKLNFTHGWKTNKHHAEATAREFGDHIFYGHTHDHQESTPHFRKDQAPYAAVSCGCLCSRNPSYMKKHVSSRWINGFVYIEVRDNGEFNHHWLAITGGRFTFGGHTWTA